MLFQKPPTTIEGLFYWIKMENEYAEVIETVIEVYEEYSSGFSSDYPRIRELLKAGKELSQAKGMLAAWEIFREGISDQYPELLKWCPLATITIHDPELPGVVIIDSVKI